MSFDGLVRDARDAARGLARNPLFSIVSVLTLAIGVGATTAVFTVVDGVLLKPLPYPNPDELTVVTVKEAAARFLSPGDRRRRQ